MDIWVVLIYCVSSELTKREQQLLGCISEFDPARPLLSVHYNTPCLFSFLAHRAKRSFSSCKKTWWRFLTNSTRWACLILSHHLSNLFLDYFFIPSLFWRFSLSHFIIPSIRNSPLPLLTLSVSHSPSSRTRPHRFLLTFTQSNILSAQLFCFTQFCSCWKDQHELIFSPISAFEVMVLQERIQFVSIVPYR